MVQSGPVSMKLAAGAGAGQTSSARSAGLSDAHGCGADITRFNRIVTGGESSASSGLA